MKKRNLFRNIILIFFAVIFVAAAGIGDAWAYFTTYASAQGGNIINLGFKTTIEEDYKDGKIITIKNLEGEPVYVRARAYCEYPERLTYVPGANWVEGDVDGYGRWYNYNEILKAGDKTTELKIEIKFPKKAEDGDELNVSDLELENGDEFNVVVVYESTLVRYDEEGKPYADWSATLDSESDEWTVTPDPSEGEGGSEG